MLVSNGVGVSLEIAIASTNVIVRIESNLLKT